MTIVLYFVVMLAFCVVFTLEVIAPATGARCDRRWMYIAGVLNIAQIGFTLAAGIVFQQWFAAHALLSLPAEWPDVYMGFLCFMTSSFLAYWWHRAMHRYDVLWRVFHQLHHSPQRIEALTSFYMHPFDGVAATLISSLCAYLIFGASVNAAAWSLLFAALYNLFIHADRKTPYWLGYLLARPEMHRVHHRSDYHANNYGLPIWDLMFGTWENPRHHVPQCGFSADKCFLISDMLRMRDVHLNAAAARDRGDEKSGPSKVPPSAAPGRERG